MESTKEGSGNLSRKVSRVLKAPHLSSRLQEREDGKPVAVHMSNTRVTVLPTGFI